MKLHSDHPHSDGFFADSFGGVTSESLLAERQALEPTYSKNIIKLQITDNHILFGVHSKSKSF